MKGKGEKTGRHRGGDGMQLRGGRIWKAGAFKNEHVFNSKISA